MWKMDRFWRVSIFISVPHSTQSPRWSVDAGDGVRCGFERFSRLERCFALIIRCRLMIRWSASRLGWRPGSAVKRSRGGGMVPP